MYFDRFDIAEAWYLALAHCHGGQWSREYARLCKLSRSFRPRPSLSVETLSENAREIYEAACARMLERAHETRNPSPPPVAVPRHAAGTRPRSGA